MNYYAQTAFFNGLFGLFSVYYVFLRNPRALLNQTFSLFGLAVAGWSLVYAAWCWADNPLDAERYVRIHMTFCAFIPATFFHFTCVFTNNHLKFAGWVWGLYGVSALCAALMHTPFMIAGVKTALVFSYWPDPGIMMPWFVAYFSALVMFCLGLIGAQAYERRGHERTQSLIVLLGFVFGFLGGWTNWFLWFDIPILPMANFFVGLLFATMLYVMVRYGVMDRDLLLDLVRNNRLTHMGLLMAGINHEIRSPLYLIRAQIDRYLTKETGPSEAKTVFLKTQEQLDRISAIMQKFSTLVKPRPGAYQSKENSDVSQVITRVRELVETQLGLGGIALTVQMPSERVMTSIDPVHLEEILLNLVMNAAQAVLEKKTASGAGFAGKIELQVVERNEFVVISIRDNGMGVKDLKNLFQVFSTTKPEGTGLGLYISKLLVEKYRGQLTVESKVNEGAVFFVKLRAVCGHTA